MQVILRDRLENLGEVGDVVDVRPGYARNYLIPKGLAYEATKANVRRIEAEKAAQARREGETLNEARQRASAIEGVSLTFHARAGQEGKLFGSITSADIADKLAEQGVQIDRRTIELDEPIKSLGVTSVPVRLHPQVRPEIKVWVIAED
ncbi:MAG: 50S ribosomal protein L9 [Gemmatimonadetes bacterium]|jgi:large subunit ribosomal protein L9|nr:50S ribosomal protein L9 [Gemmatimonadota bacterium]